VSHSEPLIAAIDAAARGGDVSWQAIELVKEMGETRVKGADDLHRPPWQWPHR
jgi:hypothetical protein